ncbi:MAG: HD domain-containing protein [Anaerolineae bacterium]|nr:HD domain-containing protein [Anaerolineae bacterium]
MITRLRQGLRAVFAFALPVNFEAAAGVLPEPLMGLFQRMRRSEQLHSLLVMQTLIVRGYTEVDVLIAALLHDCGKSRYPFTLPERILVVGAKKLAPHFFASWAAGEPRGWKRPFVIAAQHPDWSAQDMAAAGAPALAVALARRHQDRIVGVPTCEADRLLVALQAADNDN